MALSPDSRESRTRREERAPDSYQAYLNSPGWRWTRNEALKRARWTCRRCGSRRDLQVHHRSYQRLGAELPSDLEVVCFRCHNQHHQDEADGTGLGVYLKLASTVLERDPFARIADLSEDLKRLCVEKHIAIDAPKVHKAISMVTANRSHYYGRPYVSAVGVQDDGLVAEAPVLSHPESCEILARLRAWAQSPTAGPQPMPRVKVVTQGEADRLKAFEMITRAMEASIARCEALEQQAEP